MYCPRLMRYSLNIATTTFNYSASETELTGLEIADAMEASLTRQFFSSLVISACIFLFFYAFFFAFFWFIEKRGILTFVPVFRMMTLGRVEAHDISGGHVFVLTCLMLFVSMMVASGMSTELAKVIFSKMMGVWI